jgi:hypothetical protein
MARSSSGASSPALHSDASRGAGRASIPSRPRSRSRRRPLAPFRRSVSDLVRAEPDGGCYHAFPTRVVSHVRMAPGMQGLSPFWRLMVGLEAKTGLFFGAITQFRTSASRSRPSTAIPQNSPSAKCGNWRSYCAISPSRSAQATGRQRLGAESGEEPRPPLAGARTPGCGSRFAGTGLRLVHRGFRHARSKGSKGAARSARRVADYALGPHNHVGSEGADVALPRRVTRPREGLLAGDNRTRRPRAENDAIDPERTLSGAMALDGLPARAAAPVARCWRRFRIAAKLFTGTPDAAHGTDERVRR